MEIERREFYSPAEIEKAVARKLGQAQASKISIDYLTFVPDGEPTLDLNLEQEIEMLHAWGPKVGVISNASLIWRADVCAALNRADWVSLKMDAAQESVWRGINRPHGKLSLEMIMDGLCTFARGYEGELVTETMLVRGVNDGKDSLKAVANYLAQLRPAKAYISVPTRPPTEAWVCVPDEDVLHRAYQIFSDCLDNVEYLITYEGSAFSATGDVVEDLLSITAVHPMREDAALALLEQAGAESAVLSELIADGSMLRVEYEGQWFFVRCLPQVVQG